MVHLGIKTSTAYYEQVVGGYDSNYCFPRDEAGDTGNLSGPDFEGLGGVEGRTPGPGTTVVVRQGRINVQTRRANERRPAKRFEE